MKRSIFLLTFGLAGIAVLAGCGDAATPGNYHVDISGTIPNPEQVGQSVQEVLWISNKGDTLPNFAVTFNGLDSYTVDNVAGCNGQATELQDGSYAFGKIVKASRCRIVLDLVPKASGNVEVGTLQVYADVDTSSDVPDSGKVIDGAGAAEKIDINP